MKKIPYGISSFERIATQNYYYIDKTRFIPELESIGVFLFFIRPRRFGKSSLLTLLESYYDIARKEEFDTLFRDTYIKKHPTPEKNSYLILKFNFSQVNPDPEKVEESFNEHINECIFTFDEKYRGFLGDKYFKIMDTKKSAHGKIGFLFNYMGQIGRKVYVLIDEYDHFANTILSTAGASSYHQITHGTGFLRFFFNVLKGAADTSRSSVGRLFITGVSPVTMDDVTSGFNIGLNISLYPEFNELLGFTDRDMGHIIDYFKLSAFSDRNTLIATMKEWCGNYRFFDDADIDMYNPTMILHIVQHLKRLKKLPKNMVDHNLRIDYSKLRHLLTIDRRLNGNFARLSTIIERGGITADIADSFPVERLTHSENFISLLYYFGLLTYGGRDILRIPNRTVKKLMYDYLRDGYEDVDVFAVDLWELANLIRGMAYRGEWRQAFNFLADEVEKQTAIRDYLTGEKVIQTFLLAYLNVTDFYLTRTEDEFNKGFVDLYLEPFLEKYDDLKYGYLIELKYIRRGDYTDSSAKEKVEEKWIEAEKQLRQYADDPRLIGDKRIQTKYVALLFCGWELKATKEFNF
ncbi:MAG: hypothetical protein B6244_00115 [Candidatus Cloacimonetes bacterium 4572_55]|nr:MAG: hypothetical protein B6244_00115 [Candidatus Cloacimonetes bacterium 4572_55]